MGFVQPTRRSAIQMVAWFTEMTVLPNRCSNSSTASNARHAVPGRKMVSASSWATVGTKSMMVWGGSASISRGFMESCIHGSPSALKTSKPASSMSGFRRLRRW